MRKKKEKDRQIKRFIYSGDVGDGVQDWDELLHRLGNLLSRNLCSEYFPGGIMFEDQNGEYHAILTQAVIRKVLQGQREIDPWAGAEVDLPTGKGVVCQPGRYTQHGQPPSVSMALLPQPPSRRGTAIRGTGSSFQNRQRLHLRCLGKHIERFDVAQAIAPLEEILKITN